MLTFLELAHTTDAHMIFHFPVSHVWILSERSEFPRQCLVEVTFNIQGRYFSKTTTRGAGKMQFAQIWLIQKKLVELFSVE